ncbi:MAG: helix-turn-helix domain-containing protein [Rhodospirillaceae bacterium]
MALANAKEQTVDGRSSPDPIDVEVGNRLRIRRKTLGWSQTKLADAVGVTFQQIQKYERGANRISAGRLWRIGKALDVTIDYFFEDLRKVDEIRESRVPGDIPEEPKALFDDADRQAETLWLVRLYNSQEPEVRRSFLDFINSVALPRGARAPRTRRNKLMAGALAED